MNDNTYNTVLRAARRLYDSASKRHGYSLEGYCAVMAGKLHQELAKEDIHSSFLYHHSNEGGHVFLRVEDSFVDITARQFSESHPAVVIKELEDHEEQCYWKDVMELPTVHQLLKRQQLDKWPDCQWVRAT